MIASDKYLTLAEESEGIYREKGSKFIAYAFPLSDEEAFKLRAAQIAKLHPASRHVCYAWVLGNDGDRTRANDDGEPNGTAGKPILRQIKSLDLTYCGVAIVRYFGGTLLGKGGLVTAYGECAKDALNNATLIERIVLFPLSLICSYPQFDQIKNDVAAVQGEITSTMFTERCAVELSLPKSAMETFIEKWTLEHVVFRPTS